MDMTPSARVRRGVTFLNKTVPGWRPLIDLETLDISSGESCILGQVFADKASNGNTGFHYAVETYGSGVWLCDWQIARGFAYIGTEPYQVEDKKLYAAWKRELERIPA